MICPNCGHNNRLCTDCEVCNQCGNILPLEDYHHPDDEWVGIPRKEKPLNCIGTEGKVGKYDARWLILCPHHNTKQKHHSRQWFHFFSLHFARFPFSHLGFLLKSLPTSTSHGGLHLVHIQITSRVILYIHLNKRLSQDITSFRV